MIDPNLKPANVMRIVFKEIVAGDRRKFEAESNDDPTAGGGARDLRFRPFDKFGPVFSRMFPDVSDKGICRGRLHWVQNGKEHSGDAFFHPPTSARPNEGRLANVDRYLPVNKLPSEGTGTAILMLVQNDDGRVWPEFTTDRSLEKGGWHAQVRDMIVGCLRARRRANVSMVGFVDFETKESFCNGQ